MQVESRLKLICIGRNGAIADLFYRRIFALSALLSKNVKLMKTLFCTITIISIKYLFLYDLLHLQCKLHVAYRDAVLQRNFTERYTGKY